MEKILNDPRLKAFIPPPFVPPKDAEIYKDIQYSSQGHVRQRLDLYLPKPEARRPGRIPLIVFMHGGGFMFGTKESPLIPFRLLRRGIAIASLDYRLSGDALFPAAVADCRAAVRWLRATRADLDPDRVVAWGESAGAHCASMLGVLCGGGGGGGGGARGAQQDDLFDDDDDDDDDESGVAAAAAVVAGVVAYYGPTDFLQMDAQAPRDGMSLPHGGAGSPESAYVGAAIHEVPDRVARANPVTYVSPDQRPPPFFLAHGSDDHVVPHGQSVLLHEALSKVGVPSTLHTVEGADHVFVGATKEQMEALDAATDEFLASIFG